MIKKIASIILIALFVLQTIPALAFSDTDDTDYEQAVNVLSELDIVGGYEDKTFRPENSITRAEFAAMVVRLVDTSVYTIPEDVVFNDVGKKHWAFEYVNAGYHIGYFLGDGNGNFNPDVKITYSEIVKTVVTILGYRPLAEAKGGYPMGYIAVANEIDLMDGLSLGIDTYVTRGDVAILLYNALSIPKLQQTSFGTDSVEYAKDPERTILTDELKIARYEGVVTASRHTGLYGMSALDEDKILIDDVKLAVGKSDITSLLGYNLVVYANEDKKTKEETVLFYEIKEENTITTVISEDIDPSTNLNYFSYWDGEKQKSVALSNNVQIIVNAKLVPYALSDDLKPVSGTVTLLNNDGDKNVDIVIVKQYSHYVVDNLDTTDLVIYDKYDKDPLELEPKDKNVDYKIYRNTSTAKFKNISIGAVLSVLKSVDGEYMEIYLVVSPVRGKVTAKLDDDTYLIGEDGIEYKRSTDLPDTEQIALGDEGTFYLDIEGRIIKVEAGSTTEGNYCYLMDAAMGQGLDNTLSFKILNSNGDIQVLSSSEKVSFNGVKESKADILTALGGVGTIIQQPLRYAVNENGQISKIEVPTKDYDTASRYYRRGTKMFGYRGGGGSFFISTEDSVMFQVPTGGGSDDAYKVIKYTDLANYNVAYSVTGYDLEGLTVGCAVIDVAESVTSADIVGVCCVVTKVTNSVDEDGDPCYKLYYMKDGKNTETIISDKAVMKHYNIGIDDELPEYSSDITATDLKPGDVIHIRLDSNDKINSVARVLSVGGTNLASQRQFAVSRGFSAEKAFAVVQKRVDYGLQIGSSSPGLLYDITKPSGKIYLYDSRTQTVTVGTASDIIDIETNPGDPAYAYVRCSSGVTGDVIVYYQSK